MLGLSALAAAPLAALVLALSQPPSDITAPTLSGSITLTSVTTSGAHAAWPAATDNVAVAGYEVSVDTGTASWASVGNVRAFDISGKSPSTTYTVRVRAFDAAGNRSTPISAQFSTEAAQVDPPPDGSTIDVTKISPERIVVFEGSGSRVVVFEGSVPMVRFDEMSAKVPTKNGDKWTVDRDPDEESHYAADITQELADRNTTAASVTLVLVGVTQLEEPEIQVATIAGAQRTFVVAFLGGVDGEPPAGWKWVARVRCANGERFDKTTWFNKVDP